MKKYWHFIISGIITIIKCLLFVPVYVSGGIAGLSEVKYFPIAYLFEDTALSTDCVDCIDTTLHTGRFILEGIITFVVSYIIILIIVKLKNKKKGKKG